MTSIFIDFLINILSKDQPHAASTFVLKIGHVTGHMFTPRILIGELVPIELYSFVRRSNVLEEGFLIISKKFHQMQIMVIVWAHRIWHTRKY